MIITEYIEKKITTRNIKKWSKILDNLIVDEIIKIPIKYIGNQSHEKVKCVCDVCDKETEIYYYNYVNQITKRSINSSKGKNNTYKL